MNARTHREPRHRRPTTRGRAIVRGLLRVALVLAVLLALEVGQTVTSALRDAQLDAGHAMLLGGIVLAFVEAGYLAGLALWRSTVSTRSPKRRAPRHS